MTWEAFGEWYKDNMESDNKTSEIIVSTLNDPANLHSLATESIDLTVFLNSKIIPSPFNETH